jgi:hypothetical protein
MVEPKEARSTPHPMSDLQIITRFRELFGRDMTPKERNIFFLPEDDGPALKTKEGK